MTETTHQSADTTGETVNATYENVTRERTVPTRESAIRRDTLDAIVIVVPEQAALERGASERRFALGQSSHLNVPLFFFVGLPAIALIGVVIGYAVTAL